MTKVNFQILVLAALTVTATASAQENNKKGYLTGSFETNTTLYQDDSKTNAEAPDDKFGSNNYMKLDYYHGKFAAGVQLEAYQPVLLGYPSELEKAKLTNYYVSWTDKDFSVTAGTFYDQFGSGLLFRSWEDRMLGLNNAVMGARFTYHYKNIVAFKAIWGAPRLGMDFTETQVRGADISFSISELLHWNNSSLSIEGSALNRYEKISVDLEEEGGKPSTTGYSGRINFERNGFTAKGEYIDGGDKYFSFIKDDKLFTKKHANAQLLELGYSKNGLGINLTGRRLEWMSTPIVFGNGSSSNMMNYIPAMCTQYTYSLTTMNPYTPQTGNLSNLFTTSGEMGGQLDVYYHFKRGTAIGGKRGLKAHANFATYYALSEEGNIKTGNMTFRDFSFDVEKQWTKAFKMNLLYSMQEYSKSHGGDKGTWLSNIFVADLLYKFTNQFSTRLELQYLTTKEDKKDWIAAMLEVNFAPAWSIYGSDMYNQGDTKVHYYSAGVSYAKSRTRVALSYGRNKAGYVCSGGVCRNIPAYTGANLSITTSF
ncbi:DUF6029 family protein [Bacteroides sp.]